MENDDNLIIEVEGVSKIFKLPHEKQTTLKSSIIHFWGRKKGYEQQRALNNVNFNIKKGEFFGIVGRNGSGKSTLLKLLAGIYMPSKGNISVRGKLTPFIELGVGFSPELTGRENVFLNGALLGFSRSEMDKMYQDIVDFAELERSMDQKLKNYSSGMQVRLAFSIAIRAESDILLIDEVLAVGDTVFQRKCYDYFNQLKHDKKTVVFVSHDSENLLKYCDRGLLLEDGKVVTIDKIDRVINEYIDILNAQEDKKDADNAQENYKKRWGTGDALVLGTATYNLDKRAKTEFTDDDESISIVVNYKAEVDINNPVYGIIISDEDDHRVFASNTLINSIKTDDLKKGESTKIEWVIPNAFNPGTFLIAPAISNDDGNIIFDWIEANCKFRIRKKVKNNTFINVKHDIVVGYK
jgi:ABC-2 type transport system ATP-binding protein